MDGVQSQIFSSPHQNLNRLGSSGGCGQDIDCDAAARQKPLTHGSEHSLVEGSGHSGGLIKNPLSADLHRREDMSSCHPLVPVQTVLELWAREAPLHL